MPLWVHGGYLDSKGVNMRFEVDEKCQSCKGTGLYVGFAEHDGSAVVCHICKGTGCHHLVHEYEEFKERSVRDDVTHVIEVNPGIGVGADGRYALSDFGGMPYKDWLEGKPFPKGSEMRQFTCPAWWYQSADYHKKPEWDECTSIGSFSRCKHFENKAMCWDRFDGESQGVVGGK